MMRAARYHGKQDIRIERIQEPTCGQGQVKVTPAFCGMCGTDIHEWAGGPNFAPAEGSPHGITGETVPIGVGHEFSGVIKEVGPGVKNLEIGQNVAVRPLINCFSCQACKDGSVGACDHVGFVGLSGGGGGLSDAVVVPDHMIHPLPSNVPLEYGALVEPLAVGWHAADFANVSPGCKVLILGGGPIGLAVLQAVKARKAALIIVAEVAPARQTFARKFGAHHIIDPRSEDTVQRTLELNGGQGVDVAFDCAGVPASVKSACEAIKARGTVLNVAIWEKPIPFQPNALVFREGTYKAVLGYVKEDYEGVLEALKTGAIDPAGMITKTIRMEDVVDEGIKTLLKDKDNHIKIMIDMNAK